MNVPGGDMPGMGMGADNMMMFPGGSLVPGMEESMIEANMHELKGDVTITVVRARHLFNTDLDEPAGQDKVDAKVTLMVDWMEEGSSPKVDNNQDPEWNHTFHWKPDGTYSSVQLQVYDVDEGGMGDEGDLLGAVDLDLAGIVAGDYLDSWFPLVATDGSIATPTGQLYVVVQPRLEASADGGFAAAQAQLEMERELAAKREQQKIHDMQREREERRRREEQAEALQRAAWERQQMAQAEKEQRLQQQQLQAERRRHQQEAEQQAFERMRAEAAARQQVAAQQQAAYLAQQDAARQNQYADARERRHQEALKVMERRRAFAMLKASNYKKRLERHKQAVNVDQAALRQQWREKKQRSKRGKGRKSRSKSRSRSRSRSKSRSRSRSRSRSKSRSRSRSGSPGRGRGGGKGKGKGKGHGYGYGYGWGGVPASDGGAGHEYTVRRGDTLGSIARRVYGDASKWKTIYQYNKDTIYKPNNLYAGQVIFLPVD